MGHPVNARCKMNSLKSHRGYARHNFMSCKRTHGRFQYLFGRSKTKNSCFCQKSDSGFSFFQSL